MTDLLSVIVPVYNTEKYLKRCLDSITNQTYTNLEIIIVDDGSTDSSFSVCKDTEKDDPRVIIAVNNGKGVSSARNFGLNLAQGKYVTFVDSDDYIELDAYEKAINKISDCDAIFYGYYEEIEDQNIKTVISPKTIGIVSSTEAIYNCMLPIGNCYFTSVCNKIFIRDKVKDIFFDDSYVIGEDEVWLVQAVQKMSKICLYNQPLYYYRQRPDSTTHSLEKINYNWQSHLMAKEKVIQSLSGIDQYFSSIVAKEYNDLFNVYVSLYCVSSYDESQDLLNKIKKYRDVFLRAKEFSYKRKIRFSLVNLLMQLRMPKKIIISLWDLTVYKIRLSFRKLINNSQAE